MTPSEIIFSVEEAPEGGFTAKALGHSIFTQAEDLQDLREKVRDAVRCHFDDDLKVRLTFSHRFTEKSAY